jgi:hypothetical protein
MLGRAVGNNSLGDPRNAHEVRRFLLQSGKNYPPRGKVSPENGQKENYWGLGEKLLLALMGLVSALFVRRDGVPLAARGKAALRAKRQVLHPSSSRLLMTQDSLIVVWARMSSGSTHCGITCWSTLNPMNVSSVLRALSTP